MYIRLQELSSDCLRCHVKGKAKRAINSVKFSQACVKTCLEDLHYKDLSHNCLVIVIVVYARTRGINRRIKNKAFVVVVYIKL